MMMPQTLPRILDDLVLDVCSALALGRLTNTIFAGILPLSASNKSTSAPSPSFVRRFSFLSCR